MPKLLSALTILFLLALALAPGASALTAVIEINGPADMDTRPPYSAALSSYYAPLAVFFEGWKSEPRTEIVSYVWDFGDGSAPFSGFNAAHVYEAPGNYRATLTVTDSKGYSATSTADIAVLKRDGTTYYVDSQLGNDANAGTGPGTAAWKTATHAFAGMAVTRYKPGDQILFKRGQSFDFASDSVVIAHWKAGYGYLFGAYGTGAKPVIRAIGAGGGSFFNNQGLGTRFISFADLEFQCTPAGGIPILFWVAPGGGTSITFLRVDIRDFNQGWLVNSSLGPNIASGYFFDRCTSYNSQVTHMYCVARRVAILGGNFDYSGNHIAYCENIMEGVIDGNSFSRTAFGRTALRISGAGTDYPASNVWVSNNLFEGWVDPISDTGAHNGGGTRYNYCLLNFSPNTPNSDRFGEWLVFENNTVTDSEVFATISAWEHVIVRNNTFTTQDTYQNNKQFFCLDFDPTWSRRPLVDVQVVDNTFEYTGSLAAGTKGMIGLYDCGYGPHTGIVVARNIFRSSDTDVKFISVPEAEASFACLASENNLVYSADGAAPLFTRRTATPTFYTLAQWRLLTGNDQATQVHTNPNLPVPGWAKAPAADEASPIPVAYDRVEVTSGAGLREVRLWARLNDGPWIDTGMRASGASGMFSYPATGGAGRYHFATQAVDTAGNASLAPIGPGPAITYYTGGAPTDTTAPNPGVLTAPASTSVSPIPVSYTGAADEPDGSGLKSVELWVKKASVGEWGPTGLKQTGASGSFSYAVSVPGAETYYFAICAEDNVGNISPLPIGDGQAATVFSDVPADTIAPITGSLNVPAVTKTSPISIAYSGVLDEGGSGLKRVVLWAKVNGGSWLSTGLASAQAAGSFAYPPSAGDGHYEFALRAEDNAGNLSPVPSGAGAPCLFDTTPPAAGALTAPQYTKATPIKVSYSGVSDGDGSGLKKVYFWFRKDGGAWQNTNMTQTSASGSFNSSPGQNGTYEYALRVEDNAGNLSPLPTGAGQAVTVYDTVLPGLGSLAAPPQENAPPISVVYSGVQDDRSGVKTVYLWFKKGKDKWKDSGLSSAAAAGSFAFNGMTGDDTYYFALRVEDNAGNITAVPSGEGAASTVYGTRFSPGTASSPQYATAAPITVAYAGARADGSAITSVRLWYKKGLSGTWTNSGLTSSGESGQFAFTGLSGDDTYCFATQAENTQGDLTPAPQSGDGDTRTVYDTTPPNPGNMASPQYSRQAPITVTYTGASDAGSGLKQVRLWFKKGYGGAWQDSGLRSAEPDGSFTFNQMTGDDAYFFFLQAEDNAGHVSSAPSDALVFGGG
ncbi:MAG TPA: PKD domain-containing protein [Candidatus Hydrogenedentes bacterium]|nr:PKD domain-containing protein [Candidatus Hydrogenedentota bacterium]